MARRNIDWIQYRGRVKRANTHTKVDNYDHHYQPPVEIPKLNRNMIRLREHAQDLQERLRTKQRRLQQYSDDNANLRSVNHRLRDKLTSKKFFSNNRAKEIIELRRENTLLKLQLREVTADYKPDKIAFGVTKRKLQ